VHIRPALPEDIPALARVHVATWQAAYRGIIPDEQLDSLSIPESEETWRGNVRRPGRTNLVAEAEGQIVGFVAFGPTRSRDLDPSTIGEIYGIYLEPSVWRRGYGRALMGEALRQLAAAGFAEVMLWTWEINEPARNFYERLGFVSDAAVVSDRFGPELIELRYRRVLADARSAFPPRKGLSPG
jgi:ribosomal protein S18 acetylase RimI-like enzyme